MAPDAGAFEYGQEVTMDTGEHGDTGSPDTGDFDSDTRIAAPTGRPNPRSERSRHWRSRAGRRAGRMQLQCPAPAQHRTAVGIWGSAHRGPINADDG